MKHHSAIRFACAAVFSAILATTRVCAQPVNPLAGLQERPAAATYTVNPNTGAILLMPELKTAAAPAWVKPGLRLTISKIDGTVIQNAPDGNHGGSGQGFDQVDILSVQPGAVVLNLSTNVVMNNTSMVATVTGFVTTPGDPLDLWVTPVVMKKYMDINEKGVTSTRTEYQAAGKTYNAVWQKIVSNNGVNNYVHDIESGLLLHTAMDSTNGNAQYLAQSTFAGMRELKIPWTQGHLPKVLDGIHQLTYNGQVNTIIPGSIPVPPIGARMTLKIVGRGNDFLQMEKSVDMAMGNVPALKVSAVTGCAELLPLAIDPADFATLQKGQELDSDPISNVVTSVSFIGRDRRGKDVVVLTARHPTESEQRVDILYDRTTGLMIDFSFTNPILHQLTRFTLTKNE